MSEQNEHLRNDEDVDEILKLALRRHAADDGDLRQRLVASAAELGIDPAALEAAEEEYRTKKWREEALAKFHKQRWNGFLGHFWTYVSVNLGLVVMNLVSSPQSMWAIWPIMGWGIGLASHAIGVISNRENPTDEQLRAGITPEEWDSRRTRR